MEAKFETILLSGHKFTSYTIPTNKGTMLMVKGDKLIVACAYFSLETATKINEAMAIVSGIKNIDELLNAPIKAISPAAESLGIKVGMSAVDALILSTK